MYVKKYHCQRPYKKIASQIRQARLAKGLSQAELAALVGVNRRAIIHLEKGRRFNIDWIEMCAIEEILEITIEKPTVKVG